MYPATGRGRCGLPDDVVELVVRMAGEPALGIRMDHGGVPQAGWSRVGHLGAADPTPAPAGPGTARIMTKAGADPTPRRAGPTWAQFLTAQAKGFLAGDFCTWTPSA